MKKLIILMCTAMMACTMKQETTSNLDSLAIDSLYIVNETPPADAKPYTPSTNNFFDFTNYTLTEGADEKKIIDVLSPLMEQYDTLPLHTISMNYVKPGTEEFGPEETFNTSKNITVTLFYDNDTTLRAVQHEYVYSIQGSDRYANAYFIYVLKDSLLGYYEDSEESLDMHVKRFKRAAASLCPDCGLVLTAGVSGMEVSVANAITDEEMYTFERTAFNLEREVLENLSFPDLQLQGSEYAYQTEAALDAESNYDVFYTVSKSYYERFVKK